MRLCKVRKATNVMVESGITIEVKNNIKERETGEGERERGEMGEREEKEREEGEERGILLGCWILLVQHILLLD